MQDKRYVICGNAPADGFEENPDRDLRLRLWGNDGPDKITLRIEDIHKKMCKDVPDAFQDLLEIATYIYSADQATRRGADDVDSWSWLAQGFALHHPGAKSRLLEWSRNPAGTAIHTGLPVRRQLPLRIR